MVIKKCDVCSIEKKYKFLKKICGKLYCKKCYNIKRAENRKKLIDSDKNLKEDLRILGNKIAKTYKIKKKKTKELLPQEPKIKGSTRGIAKDKSYSYLTFEEKQFIFRGLIRKGVEYEEAKTKIKDIEKSLKAIRKNYGKEEKIMSKQEMLEELCRI